MSSFLGREYSVFVSEFCSKWKVIAYFFINAYSFVNISSGTANDEFGYSYRRESTGLAVAARKICQLTVKRDTTRTPMLVKTNDHRPILIR